MTKPLWAPWRLEYVQAADEQPGCVFCLAADGDDDSRLVVHRGERGRYAEELLSSFESARAEGRGLWSVCRVRWSPTRQVETRHR